jgi:peroxiredoxin Q/BCP
MRIKEKRGGSSMIKQGKKAPDFCLPAAVQDEVCLKDYHGKWIVLFFYVKDNTKG